MRALPPCLRVRATYNNGIIYRYRFVLGNAKETAEFGAASTNII